MICAVCGSKVRTSKGVLVKHREPYGSACDNAGCSIEANARGRENATTPPPGEGGGEGSEGEGRCDLGVGGATARAR